MSWSGDRSREVAKLLDFWIKCVVQASRPWISTSGIDAGSIWFNQISNELQDTTFGIICLTQENKEAPWILFEAGALAKGLASTRVCTFLIDLEPKDIRDPLAQFNHTLPTYESMWKLVSTLNSNLPEPSRLGSDVLQGVFDTYWPQFQQKFGLVLETYGELTTTEPRKQEDILTEILESTRGLERRMRMLEDRNNILHARPTVLPATIVTTSHAMAVVDPARFNEGVAAAKIMIKTGADYDTVHASLIRDHGFGKKVSKEIIEVAAADVLRRPNSDPQA